MNLWLKSCADPEGGQGVLAPSLSGHPENQTAMGRHWNGVSLAIRWWSFLVVFGSSLSSSTKPQKKNLQVGHHLPKLSGSVHGSDMHLLPVSIVSCQLWYEPWHEISNNVVCWYVRPAKAQTSLRGHTVWSEPLLVASVFYERKLLTEHHLEFLSLRWGCRGSSGSTHVKMPHCWKSHALAHLWVEGFALMIVNIKIFILMPWVCSDNIVNIIIRDFDTYGIYKQGAQWLSGRVLDSRPRGLTTVSAFGPWARHIYHSLVLVQSRKNRPCLSERLLMGRKESNQTNKQHLQAADAQASLRIDVVSPEP